MADHDPLNDRRRPWQRGGEAALLGVAGASLGHLAAAPVELGIPVAIVAGLNGLIGGWRGVYATDLRGGTAFLLDSTWATVPIAGSLVSHLVATVRGHPVEVSLSHHHNRHVYRGGLALKRGFALTVGNTISGAGDVDRPRRRRLITDHEDVHVWQQRWLGPVYPLLYVSWFLAGIVAGTLVWIVRPTRPRPPIRTTVETVAYYLNPFEWWAYSRDDLWPPPGMIRALGWPRPAVRPLAQVPRVIRRRHRESARAPHGAKMDP